MFSCSHENMPGWNWTALLAGCPCLWVHWAASALPSLSSFLPPQDHSVFSFAAVSPAKTGVLRVSPWPT